MLTRIKCEESQADRMLRENLSSEGASMLLIHNSFQFSAVDPFDGSESFTDSDSFETRGSFDKGGTNG